MTILDTTVPFRPSGAVAGMVTNAMLRAAPAAMAAARWVWPIAGRGKFWLVTRDDDVREVFARDAAFGVPYAANLQVITGGEPFFLGMGDTPAYRAQLGAARALVRDGDLAALGDEAERRAAAVVAASGGTVEVVGLVRRVAFDLTAAYLGVPEPPRGRLDMWGSRLFEFQFTGSVDDKGWVAEVGEIATALRDHIDATVAARKAAGGGPDDLLGRALAGQRAGQPGYGDTEIRTFLACMIVGGPPQPPMVVPQGVEQLLRRPLWLALAGTAARAGDDARLAAIFTEAMRFDPLAPGLKRTALADVTIAAGTRRATTIPAGATVVAAFASAMRDPRRLSDPRRFDPGRLPHEYIHFGHGLHECFGRAINGATLHRMVKPLLARGIRRAAGAAGKLRKAGPFADRLVVRFG